MKFGRFPARGRHLRILQHMQELVDSLPPYAAGVDTWGAEVPQYAPAPEWACSPKCPICCGYTGTPGGAMRWAPEE